MVKSSPTELFSCSRFLDATIACLSPIFFFESNKRPMPTLSSYAESIEKIVAATLVSGYPTLCNWVKNVQRPDTPSTLSGNSSIIFWRILSVFITGNPAKFVTRWCSSVVSDGGPNC